MTRVIEPEVVESVSEEQPKKKPRAQVRYKIRNLPPEVRRELDRRLQEQDFDSFESLSIWLERDHGQRISRESLHNYYKNNFDPLLKAVKIAALQSAEVMRVTGGDDDLMMSAVLFRLVQTAIFDLLVEVNTTRQLIARIPEAEAHSQAVLQGKAANAADQSQNDAQDHAQDLAQDPAQDHSQDHAAPDHAQAQAGVLVAKYSNKVELAAITALGKTTAMVSKAIIELQSWRAKIRDSVNEQIAATSAKVSQVAREGGLSAEVEETIRSLLTEIKV